LSVWAPGAAPLPAKPYGGRGRPPSNLRRDKDHHPVSAKDLAMSLPARAFRSVTWREGTNAPLRSRFCALRVRPAYRDDRAAQQRAALWLLIEWPKGDAEPAKYWLSTLSEATPLKDMVDLAKLRWRIERDYQDLKQEIGLGHYEGRSWRGFHHHATLSIAAYGFLISERETIPPSGPRTRRTLETSQLPENHKPRGAPDPHRTPRPAIDRDLAQTPQRRPHQQTDAMSMLYTDDPDPQNQTTFVTQ
jgi:SRSO17 transposase